MRLTNYGRFNITTSDAETSGRYGNVSKVIDKMEQTIWRERLTKSSFTVRGEKNVSDISTSKEENIRVYTLR